MMVCLSCPLILELERVKTGLLIEIYWSIAPYLGGMLSSLLMIWLMAGAAKTWGEGENLKPFIKQVVGTLFLASVLMTVLVHRPADNVPLFFSEVLWPAEAFALGVANQILGLGPGYVPSSGGWTAFAQNAEAQIWQIVDMVAVILRDADYITGLSRIVGGALLLLPYLFVLGILIAFLLEAMFKFFVVGALSPFAIPSFIFKVSRPFAGSVMKLALAAGLVLVTLAGAFALTMWSIGVFTGDLVAVIDLEASLKPLVEAYDAACGGDMESARQAEACAARAAELTALKHEAENQKRAFTMWSREWALAFALGLVSVLFHLHAKTLATQLVGGSDGPGPAAAVVASGKALVGVGFAATHRGARSVLGGFGGLGGGSGSSGGGGIPSLPASGGRDDVLKAVFPDMNKPAPSSGGGGGGSGLGMPDFGKLTDSLNRLSETLRKGGGKGA